jgi:single-stranded-DNA-specific exonuclease
MGYLADGVVAISGRAASRDLHIPNVLRAAFARIGATPPANFAHGHPQASGGHLPPEEYGLLLKGLGFSE